MAREHYPLHYRLAKRDAYLIWHTGDEPDGLVVNDRDQLLAYPDLATLHEAAAALELSIVAEDGKALDLDLIRCWLRGPRKKTIQCLEFLDAWNLFDDLSRTVTGERLPSDAATERVYQKLFAGCNLPVFTPAGKHYVPLWRKPEVRLLRRILDQGMSLFQKHVTPPGGNDQSPMSQ